MTDATLKNNGTPNWAACATTDLSAAEVFYRSVFGWESERATANDGTEYSFQRLGEKMVSVLYEFNEKLRSLDVPPHWEIYFGVDDVKNTVKKVTQADGKLAVRPYEEPV